MPCGLAWMIDPEGFRIYQRVGFGITWKNIEELDSVKEFLDRIDTALQRLDTLKEGL